MPDLIDLTAQAFAVGGPLERALKQRGRDYAVNPTQVKYAELVAKAFAGDGDVRGIVTLLEGETGVGKTLGYLVVLCLLLGLTGRRALVSTYTLDLQRQIVDREFEAAAAVAKEMTGADLVVAPQKGLRNFISPTRVKTLIGALDLAEALDPETRAVLESLAAFPGGDLGDWLETNELPRHVGREDVCLLSASDPVEAAAYLDHLEAARAADVQVVTHALMLRYCLKWNAGYTRVTDALFARRRLEGNASPGTGDGEDDRTPPFDVAVIDEADRIPDAADSLFNSRISVPMIESVGEDLKAFGFDGVSEACAELRAWMDETFGALRSDRSSAFRAEAAGGFIILGGARSEALRDEARDWADRIASRLREGVAAAVLESERRAAADPFQDRMSREDAQEIEAIAYQLQDFVKACDAPADKLTTPALRWTPVKAYASFSTIPLWPGHLVARLWKEGRDGTPPAFLRSLVLTSATLDDPGASSSKFHGFRRDIGLNGRFHRYNDVGSAALAPEKFGKMKFVLADRRVPLPKDDTGDGNASNPDWIRYAAQGLAEARRRGGRALVLLPSYRDTEAIAEAARKLGVDLIEHQRGSRFIDYLPRFQDDPDGMLITPAAWEGVDLPGKLKHVIIPRVPYPMIDSARNRARLDVHVMRGCDIRTAEGYLFGDANSNSRRKLKQGFGRLIRSVTDGGTVWVLDPRFPLPESITRNRRLRQVNLPAGAYTALAYCIPVRFRSGIAATYQDAEVLMMDAAEAAAAE